MPYRTLAFVVFYILEDCCGNSVEQFRLEHKNFQEATLEGPIVSRSLSIYAFHSSFSSTLSPCTPSPSSPSPLPHSPQPPFTNPNPRLQPSLPHRHISISRAHRLRPLHPLGPPHRSQPQLPRSSRLPRARTPQHSIHYLCLTHQVHVLPSLHPARRKLQI